MYILDSEAPVPCQAELCYGQTMGGTKQTKQSVGLNLSKPVFSRGQLHIGCTKVGNPFFILAKTSKQKAFCIKRCS